MTGALWRRVLLPAALLVLSSVLSGCRADAFSKPVAAPPTVVLVTVDGVRWDYPDRFGLETFAAMRRSGLSAERLLPPFPSLTWVCHATLATGTYPDKHGIAANGFLDRASGTRFSKEPEARWLLEPPVWALAEGAGIKSAVLSWPLSDGDWHGVAPSYRRGFQKGKGGSDEATVEALLDLLGMPPDRRPRLILAWTSGADDEGHDEGPEGPAVRRAMVRADATLRRLREGIRALGPKTPVVLVVASDHGMSSVERAIDLAALVPKKAFLPYIATSGPMANLYTKDARQKEEVRRALEGLPAGCRVFDRESCPPDLHYAGCARAGDLVVLAPPGATFWGYSPKPGVRAVPKGNHGYPASNPDVQGLLILEGPGVPAGKTLPRASAVDVAPTLCRLLGIPPPPRADGRSLIP
ncbi:MAG: alkaline phosphatase family protein [Acidobacteriota bacterium]